MKKTVLVATAVAGLVMTASPMAWAQDTGPGTDACTEAQASFDSARLAFDRALEADQEVERVESRHKALADARAELAAAVAADNATVPPLEEDSQRTKDAKAAVGELEAEVAGLPNLDGPGGLRDVADRTDAGELREDREEAREARNDACADPVTTTPPTPAPDNDVDCDEVSASEAQRILDADRSDPHNLDQDGDGLACEVDEILPEPAGDVIVNNNIAVPSGGIATGVGPRDS